MFCRILGGMLKFCVRYLQLTKNYIKRVSLLKTEHKENSRYLHYNETNKKEESDLSCRHENLNSSQYDNFLEQLPCSKLQAVNILF